MDRSQFRSFMAPAVSLKRLQEPKPTLKAGAVEEGQPTETIAKKNKKCLSKEVHSTFRLH